jgi:hypothetical protein
MFVDMYMAHGERTLTLVAECHGRKDVLRVQEQSRQDRDPFGFGQDGPLVIAFFLDQRSHPKPKPPPKPMLPTTQDEVIAGTGRLLERPIHDGPEIRLKPRHIRVIE